MKTYGGVDVEGAHVFFTSALVGVSGQLHAPANLSREREPPVLIRCDVGEILRETFGKSY
jgi:hypothetical protein